MGIDHDMTRTAFRTCPLCEAGCGLEITVKGGQVTRIRGDQADVFSKGFICPKGSTLKQLHDDPDRLRRPLVKRDGVHVEVEWHEAWAVIADRLPEIIGRHGREAVAVYMGNPSAHSLSAMLYNRSLLQALGTRRRFSASTVDQAPRQVAAGYVFGTAVSVPVPDLDHTDFLVILGANPYASNGSLCTAPDFPGRIEAIQARGGTVVVADPRRSRTAEQADHWLPIIPGTDPLLLAAMVTTLAEEGLIAVGDHVTPWLQGLDEVVAACASFTPESVAAATGLSPADIRMVARGLAAAPSGSVYGRIGTTTAGFGDTSHGVSGFGTTTSWLIDVVNTLTGNLDRRGGAMFTTPVAGGATTRGKPGSGKGFSTGRGATVARGLPEVMGEYPAAAMAEEITDAGDEGIKVLITVAGNPVLSTPHSRQLDVALAQLEFMVSVDMYLNETTRHADVVLPPPSQLQRDHYDLLLLQFAVRNVANYSDPVLPRDEGQPDEWEILAKLGLVAAGLGPDAEPSLADDMGIQALVQSAVADQRSPLHGREAGEILSLLGSEPGPARMIDFMLQTGPFGAGFGAAPEGASLQRLRANPHGVDYGPLQPRLPEILRTPSGRIELNHPVLMADLARLQAAAAAHAAQAGGERGLLLVGRRHLRSNNSWMHNIEVLVKGKARCTLQVHPDDAARLGLVDGGAAEVRSRVGAVVAPVEVTDAVRPGVVSLPHGWGHDLPGTRLRVAAERAGVNSNVLADHLAIDPLSGTSVLNGIPVAVAAV
ncbi:MAG: molybdopterin oxidoreductase family protein [Actinomycetota bacterium]|nr:molybdopterin oxidoreductase family protein [Actinomycetota bacterium]